MTFQSSKEFTASELTAYAIEYYTALGYRVRRVNNIPVRGRKNNVQKGWPDVQGYTNSGKIVLCEVKKNGDRLSEEQKHRLLDCHTCGGIAQICYQDGNRKEIIDFLKYKQ
jgi:hypothetical protein